VATHIPPPAGPTPLEPPRPLPEQDLLERLRRQSGLSIDAEGRFLHLGEPITHARTLEVLWRSLSAAPDGGWRVQVGQETAFVEVDETPWAVRGLRVDGSPPSALTLLLCGGGEASLDPASLRVGPDGVFRCRLPGGAAARFTRAGQAALGTLLEDDPVPGGGAVLVVDGVRYPLTEPPPR
jgi:hypothetical protein